MRCAMVMMLVVCAGASAGQAVALETKALGTQVLQLRFKLGAVFTSILTEEQAGRTPDRMTEASREQARREALASVDLFAQQTQATRQTLRNLADRLEKGSALEKEQGATVRKSLSFLDATEVAPRFGRLRNLLATPGFGNEYGRDAILDDLAKAAGGIMIVATLLE